MMRNWKTKYAYAMPTIIVAVLLLIVNASVGSTFLNPGNWNSLVIGATPFIIVGMAQAAPVLAGGGGIDLSIGPLIAVVNAVIATALVPLGWDDPVRTVLVVLAIGVVSGLLNGLLVAVARVQPVIATLATFLAYQGLAVQILPMAGGTVPVWLGVFTKTVYGIPVLVFLILAICIAWSLLIRTAYHRNLLAVGGDIRAAYTAGVDVTFVRIGAYVIAGVFASLVGMALSGVMGSGDPMVGTSFTLTSISAVALGGVSLAGGRGGMLGPAIAGLILFLIQNLFTIAQVSVFYLQIFYGLIVLAALTFNSLGFSFRSAGASAP
jgi:ribose transport system permease protein